MVDLNTFLSTNVFYFMLIFARIGAAVMIMPGVGDFICVHARAVVIRVWVFVYITARSYAVFAIGCAWHGHVVDVIDHGVFNGAINRNDYAYFHDRA